MARLRQRAQNVVGDNTGVSYVVGNIGADLDSGEVDGDGVDAMRLIFGDLVDVGELIAEGGASIVSSALGSVMLGRNDPVSSCLSLFVQGVATGVLMERARWERGNDAS